MALPFGSPSTGWFASITDALFKLEFVLVQLYLVYHLIRALFAPHRRRRGGAHLDASRRSLPTIGARRRPQ